MFILTCLCLLLITLCCFFQAIGNYELDLTYILGLGAGCCSSIILLVKAFDDYCRKNFFIDSNESCYNNIGVSNYETINTIKYNNNDSKYAKEAMKKYNNPIKITVCEKKNKDKKSKQNAK